MDVERGTLPYGAFYLNTAAGLMHQPVDEVEADTRTYHLRMEAPPSLLKRQPFS